MGKMLKAFAAMLVSASVAAAGPASAQKHGGVLQMLDFASPAAMSIHEESMTAGIPMMGVFNNLVVFDQQVAQNSLKSIVPDLATGWSWSEDGKELTFPLRRGVKWHDGKPFTAADDYRLRGVHVRLDVRWDWQAEEGDDTQQAIYRGTRCRLAVRQGPAERFRPELYVLPDDDVGPALRRRIAALQPLYPGIGVEAVGAEWRIAIPDRLRIGHDAAFAAFTRRFLAWVADPALLPVRERPNLLAKYRVTTGAVELSRS